MNRDSARCQVVALCVGYTLFGLAGFLGRPSLVVTALAVLAGSVAVEAADGGFGALRRKRRLGEVAAATGWPTGAVVAAYFGSLAVTLGGIVAYVARQ